MKERERERERNITFITFLQQIVGSKLLQAISDDKKIISIVGSN